MQYQSTQDQMNKEFASMHNQMRDPEMHQMKDLQDKHKKDVQDIKKRHGLD